jgi:Vitamin K-dependent gamma-carboxylase
MAEAHFTWLWCPSRGFEVTLQSLRKAWTQFFFSEQSPIPIALFRIVYSLLVIATLILLKPDWLNWYGAHGWVTFQTARTLEPGTRLNLFSVILQSDIRIEALFWIFLTSAALLALGFLSRLNSVVVFICLTSIHQRNLYINHGGDTFLRLAGLFLIFAPAGAALSIDRLIRIRRGRESGGVQPCSPWAQRMIQLQLSLLYLATFLLKMKGTAWLGGTALYYLYHLDELKRFPLPSWFFHPALLTLGSWGALLLEFSLGVLIWVKELRYILLALGVLFHLWLEYSLSIPMFQWDILSAYVLFVYPDDWNRAVSWLIWQARTVLDFMR